MNILRNSTAVVKAACAIIFSVFCFLYLYFYQADVLTAAQHVASKGTTHYVPLTGAIIITVTLYLLQVAVQAVAKLKDECYALTFFPSFLLLAVLTDVQSDIYNGIYPQRWAWLLPLLLVVWLGVAYVAKQYQAVTSNLRNDGLLSQANGINLTLMTAMMLMTALTGNGDRQFHQLMHVESLVKQGKFQEAQTASESFPMEQREMAVLHAYTLAHRQKLGDELFKTLDKRISSIKPQPTDHFVMIPKRYLTNTYKISSNWQLSEMLVTRNLVGFADKMRRKYAKTIEFNERQEKLKSVKRRKNVQEDTVAVSTPQIPQHYQEAVILYNDLNPNSRILISNPQLDEKYADFKASDHDTRTKKYSGTYWYYWYEYRQ